MTEQTMERQYLQDSLNLVSQQYAEVVERQQQLQIAAARADSFAAVVLMVEEAPAVPVEEKFTSSPAPVGQAVQEALPVAAAEAAEEVVELSSPPVPLFTFAKLLPMREEIREQLAELTREGLQANQYEFAVRTDTMSLRQKLLVNFQLDEVPSMYQQRQTFFLVVSNAQTGDPISGLDEISTEVSIDGLQVPIWAAVEKQANLRQNQRIALEKELNFALQSGIYLVEIFSDQALVGKAEFDFAAPDLLK
ncbi:MAG: hypothetical protein AAGA31_10960 [Bacteroidota bacterium]